MRQQKENNSKVLSQTISKRYHYKIVVLLSDQIGGSKMDQLDVQYFGYLNTLVGEIWELFDTSYDLAEMLLDMENLFIQQWTIRPSIMSVEMEYLPHITYFDEIVQSVKAELEEK